MASKMKEVAGLKEGLNADERNLLSVAYKNVVGMQRSAWRIISALEEKEEQKGSVEKHNLAVTYREKIEGEVKNVCKEVIDLLNAFLIPSAETGDEKVFYHKMAGDYHRYVAEVSSGAERTTASKSSSECYQAATDAAASSLPPTHPIRLGLALNFSVFHYEILEERDNACDIAKKAFDDAIAELDTLPEESYKDSTLILQLLRDNLTLWTSDSQNEQADE